LRHYNLVILDNYIAAPAGSGAYDRERIKMSLQKLFSRFKQKLLFETALKSLLFAVMTSALTVFAVSLVYHIMLKETALMTTAIAGGGVFLLSFIIFFAVTYPTKKKVARRIDSAGLQERASTMLELKNDKSEIAALQRKDAADKIGSLSAENVKFNFRKKEFILCVVSVCLAAVMLCLPATLFAFNVGADTGTSENDEVLRELLDKLRQDVKDAELNEELKEELNDIIDKLEEKLKQADSELEQAAQIEQAKQEMEDLMNSLLTKKKIGEELQKFDLTRKLGEAISKGDTEKVSAALEELEDKLKEDRTLTGELSSDITSALVASGVEETDSLFSALNDFSGSLFDLDTSSGSFEKELEEIFDKAEEEINAALEEQAKIEKELGKLEDEMSDAKDEVLGNEKPEESGEGEPPEGEKPEGEKPDGEKPDGEKPDGEMPDGEMPDGERPEGEMPEGEGGEGELNGMTEGIYDPVSGSVKYGEVYAAYYAEYLRALENGGIPEELAEIYDKYFSSLN